MKIISSFRDYYDSASAFGIDETVIYERHFECVTNDYWSTLPLELGSRFVPLNYAILFYCGEIKPFLIKRRHCLKTNEYIDKYYWSEEEIKEVIKEVFPTKGKFDWEADMFRSRWEQYKKRRCNENPIDVHRKYNSPLILYAGEHIYINPCLKELGFKQNAAQTFNEISSFLSGILGSKENDIIEVSNEQKILQHGFDDHSFRQIPPGSKKERRRQNKLRKKLRKN